MDAAAQAHNALANEHETDLLGIVSATVVVVVSFPSIFFVCKGFYILSVLWHHANHWREY